MSKLKVCIIYNGAAHYRSGIFKQIDQEFDCEWFIAQGYGNIKQLPLSFFINAHSLPIKGLAGGLYCQPGTTNLLLSKVYDLFFIFGEFPNLSTWWGLLMHNILNRKKKVYFWSHGILRVRKWPRRALDKLFFKLPYATFTYGDHAREVMIRRGLDGDRIFPIHNSLDYNEQIGLRNNFSDIYRRHFGNGNPVLFFIGRLTKVKRLDMLVRSVDLLRKRGEVVNLVFIGDGPETSALKKQVETLGLTCTVWFYGPCYDESEKSVLIANADLCVAPGNIGLTAIDSLMYGTPAITMDNIDMQMPEFEALKEGITGSFFHESDVEDLAVKIHNWLNSGVDRARIRQNCYNEIDSFWNPEYQISIIKDHLKP